ncbi:hypothetical protein FACS1894132_05070 [Clostridia bacterium]|nr:hypothetical protein FACS1894132_05070 [Clostridia bacterium]
MNNKLKFYDEFGYNDEISAIELDKLVTEVVQLLRLQNKTIATAESCTGGLIAQLLTSVSGASEIFEYGFVTYSEIAKILLLDPENTSLCSVINACGVVSMDTAKEMSFCLMQRVGADIYVSVTGCAGPNVTTLPNGEEQRVGEVYVGFTVVEERPVTFVRLLKLWEFEDISRNAIRNNTAKYIFYQLRNILSY